MSKVLILLFAAPLLLLSVYNTRIVMGIIILALFVELYWFYISYAEFLTFLLLFSFLVMNKFNAREIKSPELTLFLIFILSILPSYINSVVPGMSLYLSLRLVFFFLTFTILGILLTDYKKFRQLINVYLFGALANGLYVIYLAVTTGKRIFGFTGIMYVDLVGVALMICFLSFLYLKRNRFIYAVLSLIFLSALIFMQTRGNWIVSGTTILLIMLQAFFYSRKVGVSKIKMFLIVIFALISIGALFSILQNVNPAAIERVNVKARSDAPTGVHSASTGSLATRFFIWTTAWNAFKANPIIGVGFYTFPFASSSYYDFDSELYEIFVEDLTPHTTILALLSEAGIIGFTGFLIFLFGILILARRNIRNSKSEEQWFFSQLIFWLFVYISFSMIVTDAWLWGTLLITFGFILGMSVGNGKIIKSNKEPLEEEYAR